MITDTQRRNQILKRISRIPKDKLKDLEEYISKLEQNICNKKRALSYAGAWEGIENDVFEELTNKLISNRGKNRRRINE